MMPIIVITGSSYSGNYFSKGYHATKGLRIEIADTSCYQYKLCQLFIPDYQYLCQLFISIIITGFISI